VTTRASLAARERRRHARLRQLEQSLRLEGYGRIAGVDEVGMGPLAGPVVACAVILPPGARLRGLDDSKKLPRALRERLAEEIAALALDLGVGFVTVDEIDTLNIYRAGLEAMRRAVAALAAPPDVLGVDARRVPGIDCRQESMHKGDGRVAAIAAASVVAKVRRDSYMAELDRQHPGYGFARHSGYSTREHLAALRSLGPCPAHRRSFEPVRAAHARLVPPCPTS
jgi:ribonuclease HII